MPFYDFSAWIWAIVAALSIGLSKAGFGGMNMVAILVMAHMMPAKESTGAILPMLILADIFAVWAYHQHGDRTVLLKLLSPAFIGIVAGWMIMPHIDAKVFAPLIGWIVLILTVVVIVQKATTGLAAFAMNHRGLSWFFGLLAGVTTMLANSAGPVTSLYFLSCGLEKMRFVGTSAWFFLIVNVAKVPFSASLGLINAPSLLLNLCLAPAVIAGVYAGRWLLGKVNQSLFEWLMISFSLLGALRLLFG